MTTQGAAQPKSPARADQFCHPQVVPQELDLAGDLVAATRTNYDRRGIGRWA